VESIGIVETVVGQSLAELRSARDRVTDADLVELRLDGVRDVDVAGALAGRARPVVVTCRPVREGGRFDGTEEERLRLLGQAARLGAEFVDIEWKAGPERVPRGDRTRLVVSHHDFEGVPADLTDRVRAMHGCGGDVIKIAVTARSLRDCLTLKRAVDGDRAAHVAIAMGSAGHLTRVWPAWLGSCWTYAGSAAPGQIPARDLARVFRVKTTTASSRLYGIAGSPLHHSASPAMHNAAFAHLGLDCVYVPLETGDASEFLEVADAVGLAGASVTAPLKAALFDRVQNVDELAKRTGAVNTLRQSPRGWLGRNLDVVGFLTPIDKRSVTLRQRRAVVLGAGGAARSAVWALKSHGARVEVSARRPEQARALARAFKVQAVAWPAPPFPSLKPGWDVLVNATSVGTRPAVGESPLDRADLTQCAGKLVYDLVYNPVETTLMRWAREAGADVIGGLEMLIDQACRQFEWWTDQRAPRDVVESAARAFVGSDEADNL
jgi:3-dehydroquinate dehydratase/shikimate dehydrogenase